MSGQHCESYDVKRETVHCYPVNSSLLTAVARDGWNLSAVFNLNVSRDEVEGNKIHCSPRDQSLSDLLYSITKQKQNFKNCAEIPAIMCNSGQQ